MKNYFCILLLFIFSQSAFAQTTLNAGDIAILQYNADGSPLVIKFLALRSMESGTTINFTNNGWQSDNTFRTGEGTDTWTAPSNISCGDVITFTLTNISLGTNGDQILAYQGLAASPTFIYAINNEGSATWQTTANNSSRSALPLGLTNGTTAVAITEIDNAMYDSSTLVGTRSAILSAISNNANWGGSDTVTQNFTSTFTSQATWTTSWNGTGNPADYFLAIIDGDYDTSTDGNFSACECQINASRTLTVNSGGTITVENGIVNDGAFTVESGGSVVQETSDGSNTGSNYTVQRTSSSQQEEGDFTYWSSPMSSATLSDVASARRYFSFNASTQTYIFESPSSSMTAGVGYALSGDVAGPYPGSYTASFGSGVFNNGDISVALVFSNDAVATNDWNLIGNPYPSAIDADTFLNDNSTILGGTLYFWTHNTADSSGNNTADDYASYNTTGGTAAISGGATPDGNIASGQGFFAQAITTGNVTFTNSMRVAGNNNIFFRNIAKQTKIEKDRIWLNLTSNDSFNQILIGFIEGATEGVDRSYDGARFSSGANSIFYSLIDDEPFAIQGRPPLNENEIVPLGYQTTKANDYTISIDRSEGQLVTSKVLLFDKLLNTIHDLKKENYTFFVGEANTFNDRFDLIIQTDIQDTDPITELIVHKERGRIYFSLNTDENVSIENVEVYNILGALLNRVTVESNKEDYEVFVNVSKEKSFLLIARVTLSDGRVLIKKIVNTQ